MLYTCKLILISIFTAVFGSQIAYALPRPTSTPERDTRLFTDLSYFTTKANYDEGGGSFSSLPNGQYYKLIEVHLGGEHWILPHMSLFTDVGFARAESYDGGFTRTNSAPTEVLAGLRYVAIRSPRFALIPELQVVYPLNRVDTATDDVLMDEGALKIFGGLWAETWVSSFNPYLQVGYLYQDESRAHHILYLLGLGYGSEAFRIGAELYGNVVAVQDGNSANRIYRDAVTARVNGDSWKFFGVNPSTLGARVVTNIAVSDAWALNLGFDHTINGKASAAGWTALVGLEYGFDFRENSVVEEVPRPRALEPEKRMLQKFEPEQPTYDPTLFDEPKPKVKARKMAPKKPKGPTKESIDKSLEDVQKSLEQ